MITIEVAIAILKRCWLYVLVAVACLFGGYKLTADHYRAKIADIERQQAEAVAQAHAHVEQVQTAQQTVTNEVAASYEKQIANIRRDYDGTVAGLRDQAAAGCSWNLPAVPAAASKPNADTCPYRIPANIAEIMRDADEQTARLKALQDWVRKQQAVE